MAEQYTVLVARFLTLGGGTVALHRAPDKTAMRLTDHWWECVCGADHNDTIPYPDPHGSWLSAAVARKEANTHASECRSMPLEVED